MARLEIGAAKTTLLKTAAAMANALKLITARSLLRWFRDPLTTPVA
jgi:hypothetical protein